MDPRPDHWETSYKGTGHLAGRKTLITGGFVQFHDILYTLSLDILYTFALLVVGV